MCVEMNCPVGIRPDAVSPIDYDAAAATYYTYGFFSPPSGEQWSSQKIRIQRLGHAVKSDSCVPGKISINAMGH